MPRKIILYIAESLDGYIATKDHDLTWLPQIAGNEMEKFYKDFSSDLDLVVMGYTTYQQITEVLSPQEWPYSTMKSYVWTKSPESKKSLYSSIIFTNEDIPKFVQTIMKKSGGNIWLLGGGKFIAEFIKRDLVDEYLLTIIPVILGGGISLFPRNHTRINLELKQCFSENGMIQTQYIKKMSDIII